MTRSVFFLSLCNFLAIGAGFLREATVAYHFGTTAAADGFAVTLVFIEGIAVVAITGLGSYMVVPIVTRLVKKEEPQTQFVLMQTLSLWIVVISLPFAAAAVYAPQTLATILAPEFSPEQHNILTRLLQVSIPSVPLLLIGGVFSGVLQAGADYFTPVLARGLFSISIAAVIVVATQLGIVAAGIGVLLGAVLQFMVQAFALWMRGWRPTLPAWSHPALVSSVAFGLPLLLGLILTNVVMAVLQRLLASGLPQGSIAAINYAQRILNLAATLSLAIGTVSLTELAGEYAASGFSERASRIVSKSILTGIFVLTPISFLMYFYSEPIAAAIFRRGSFDERSLLLTASCLRWFSVAIVPAMVLAVLLRAYPAVWRPWHVVGISAFWTISTVVMTAVLLPVLQTQAVPAGYATGVTLTMLVSYLGLRKLLIADFLRSVALYAARIALCCALPAALLFLIYRGYPEVAVTSLMSILFSMLPSLFLFLGVFVLVCSLLRDPHIMSAWNLPPVLRTRRHLREWL